MAHKRKTGRCRQWKSCNVVACEHHGRHPLASRCMAAGCQFRDGDAKCIPVKIK